jgi:sphinganine-1-phosphate aldolase
MWLILRMPELVKDIEFLAHQAGKHCLKFISAFNEKLGSFSPVEIVILTLAVVVVVRYISEKLDDARKTGLKTLVFRIATKLPFVRGKVAAEEQKIMD